MDFALQIPDFLLRTAFLNDENLVLLLYPRWTVYDVTTYADILDFTSNFPELAKL